MYFNELVASYDRERRERDIFHDLMRYRVREVLLVASLYDSFILESDGALSDQIYGEFYKLNLTTAPRVTCAYTEDSAVEMFGTAPYDLAILMAGLDFDGPLALAERLKSVHPETPVLLLAMNNSSLTGLGIECPGTLHNIDRVFVWNGYSKLFVGMIKYVEDLHNVDNDTRVGMVRVVLLIEDSVRYYSRYLPLLYSVVMKQTQQLVEDERVIETYKILRMRGRPKVLLATSYDEAEELFTRYEPNLLTVISDVRYPRGGEVDPEAGFRFLRMSKERKPDLPVLIQSHEIANREVAYALGASFVDKNSQTLGRELAHFFQTQLGFGPFVFRDANGGELARAKSMDEFEELLGTVPPESLLYHADSNHFSTWLMARGEVRFAKLIRNYMPDDFANVQELRDFIIRSLYDLRRGKSRGVIPGLGSHRYDRSLIRLGGGSVGGKGRGLAFIKSLIDNLAFTQGQPNGMEIRLPYTAFIGIDEFESWMDTNGLWNFAWYEADTPTLSRTFLSHPLGAELVGRLRQFLSTTNAPLAVRSSGLFEDMLMVPFSGVYDTYLIPNSHQDREQRLAQLCDAIRLVYASLFSASARAYFNVASYKIEEERMAVVVQEMVGQRHGRWHCPLVAGTAHSYNYYPVSYLKPDDGLCVMAYGLGPYVVEGGESFRFSPRYPKLDIVAPEHRMSGGQRWFYALDMERTEFDLSTGEDATLLRLELSEAEADPSFGLTASTWNMNDQRLEPGISGGGPRIMDFAPILKYDAFPFAQAVDAVLEVCAKSMGIPVEIEYAVSQDGPGGEAVFYLLQIKPLIQNADKVNVEADDVDRSACLVVSDRCMGNGRNASIMDIVYVDPATWDASCTEAMAVEIGEMNTGLAAEGRPYILIGPGRWGTRDRWLGVPVTFAQISGAKAIIEADLEGFRVESSLGSHFFHNVTAMNIGYFSVPFGSKASFVDWEGLAALPAFRRGSYCVQIRTEEPIELLMDGRRGHGAIKKPGARLTGLDKSDNIYCT
ncbi:MAG: pyruvate, phosphate dikinase [Spirochaetales bacterium]|nr:MAG: pyruvate, phosphate dikinase [Spirochaetales bacterium]